MNKTIGNFKINVWRVGYPIWIEITLSDGETFKISHRDLADLEYAVKEAKRAARECLPDNYKDEV
jgi:hypothetical protein